MSLHFRVHSILCHIKHPVICDISCQNYLLLWYYGKKNAQEIKLGALLIESQEIIQELMNNEVQFQHYEVAAKLNQIKRQLLIIQHRLINYSFPTFSGKGLILNGKEYSRQLFLYGQGNWHKLPDNLVQLFLTRKNDLNGTFVSTASIELQLSNLNERLKEIEVQLVSFIRYVQAYFDKIPPENTMQVFNYTTVKLNFYASSFMENRRLDGVFTRPFYEMEISIKQLATAFPAGDEIAEKGLSTCLEELLADSCCLSQIIYLEGLLAWQDLIAVEGITVDFKNVS